MFRKIYIALDCDDDQEAAQVQRAAEELSSVFRLSAKEVLSAYPMLKNNGQLIRSSIKTIAREGKSGVMKILPFLVKNFKR